MTQPGVASEAVEQARGKGARGGFEGAVEGSVRDAGSSASASGRSAVRSSAHDVALCRPPSWSSHLALWPLQCSSCRELLRQHAEAGMLNDLGALGGWRPSGPARGGSGVCVAGAAGGPLCREAGQSYGGGAGTSGGSSGPGAGTRNVAGVRAGISAHHAACSQVQIRAVSAVVSLPAGKRPPSPNLFNAQQARPFIPVLSY